MDEGAHKTKNIRGPQIGWIVTALDSITKNTITAGFIKTGIVNPANPPELLILNYRHFELVKVLRLVFLESEFY